MYYVITIDVGFILNGLQSQPPHYAVVCPLGEIQKSRYGASLEGTLCNTSKTYIVVGKTSPTDESGVKNHTKSTKTQQTPSPW